jgi:hypothetical protein
VIATAASGCATGEAKDGQSTAQAPADRQAEIAAKGRQVMPFDLERTMHRFTKTGTGGEQTVTANDPADARQVALIREHLSEEVTRFGNGDFGDPASIHGGEMPGLRELAAVPDRGAARLVRRPGLRPRPARRTRVAPSRHPASPVSHL